VSAPQQSGNSKGRMVCRITADADPHHSYHPNHEDRVHREPRKFCARGDDGNHLCRRDEFALHLGRGCVRLRSASPAVVWPLVAAMLCDIRDANPRNERLVHSQGWGSEMAPQSWFEDLSPTRPLPLNFFQKNPALPAEEASDFKRDVPHPDRLSASDSRALLIAWRLARKRQQNENCQLRWRCFNRRCPRWGR
jgi:hypothetical protein